MCCVLDGTEMSSFKKPPVTTATTTTTTATQNDSSFLQEKAWVALCYSVADYVSGNRERSWKCHWNPATEALCQIGSQFYELLFDALELGGSTAPRPLNQLIDHVLVAMVSIFLSFFFAVVVSFFFFSCVDTYFCFREMSIFNLRVPKYPNRRFLLFFLFFL